MKKLLIIGASLWGREVYDIAKACIDAGSDFEIKGFLDDRVGLLDGFKNYPPIIGSVESYEIQKDDVFICGISEVDYKKKYSDIILAKGGEFISLIHPTAIFGNNAVIGKGCILGAYSNVSCDTHVGDFVTISIRAGMGHDSTIGDYTHIGGNCSISGLVTIGEFVTMHPGCIVVPHRKIGDHSIVGTGSVVLGNVKANTTVFGNPAKKVEI